MAKGHVCMYAVVYPASVSLGGRHQRGPGYSTRGFLVGLPPPPDPPVPRVGGPGRVWGRGQTHYEHTLVLGVERKLVMQHHSNRSPGLILFDFFIFRAGPVGNGPGPSFG